jgi:hypothetical protein
MLVARPIMASGPRVLVASPKAREREMLAEWLITEHYEPVLLADAQAVAADISKHANIGLVMDYVLTTRADLHSAWRSRAPLIPPVVIGDVDPTAQARTESLNAIYVERPLERITLMCMVLMAILEGRPERRSMRKLTNVAASVNGVASRIIDLSHEGLCVEIPRDKRVPPPVFRLSVPIVGVTVNVRRMWTSAATPDRGNVMLCGGALTQNPTRAAQLWYSLVETTPSISATIQIR